MGTGQSPLSRICYVALQFLPACLSMLSATAVAISAAAWRETKKERADATRGKWHTQHHQAFPVFPMSPEVAELCDIAGDMFGS